ncbi:type II secretion system protein [Candidatus Saccharibacteria bacterium]|nr:type II secretion system protein [Candidatus Saccharibacteria bacterium]
MNTGRGFTIVELLIVIVVIGILAVIAITSITSAQLRAKVQQNTSLAQAYGKALVAYATENGNYPPGYTTWPCLGTGTTDINNDGNYDCSWTGTTPEHQKSASFDAAIRRYVDITAGPSDIITVDINGKRLSGVTFWNITDGVIDGQPHYWYLGYIIKAPETCKYGHLLTTTGWPAFSSTRPAAGYTWQEADGGRTCLVKLPNPATL